MHQNTWVTVWVSQVSEPTYQVGRGPCLTLSTLIELSERTQERTPRELWEITRERTLIEHSLHSWSAPTCLDLLSQFFIKPFQTQPRDLSLSYKNSSQTCSCFYYFYQGLDPFILKVLPWKHVFPFHCERHVCDELDESYLPATPASSSPSSPPSSSSTVSSKQLFSDATAKILEENIKEEVFWAQTFMTQS